MDYKKTDAAKNSETRDKNKIDAPTNNLYESLVILSKRADQIGQDLKVELHDKLEEFATTNDSLEEIFENKEQIEVSRFYESLPKPTAIALDEWLNDKVYFRYPDAEED
jgi:DNA-directed RNA polymerase subunit K/omega